MYNKEVILRPVHWENIFSLLICLAFMGIEIFLIYEELDIWLPWFGVIFFGFGTIISLIDMLLNIPYLKLNEKGFELNWAGSKNFFEWNDIEAFEIVNESRSKVVVFNFKRNNNEEEFIEEEYMINETDEVWHDKALPPIINMKPEKLADLMNEFLLSAK